MQGRALPGGGRTAKIGIGLRDGRTQIRAVKADRVHWFCTRRVSAALSLVDLGRKVKLRIEHTPRYAGRQSPETSDDFRLADGRPLWYAFLNDPNALVMAATDANRARSELRDLFRIEPDIVRQLIDGSLEEAHKVLRLTERAVWKTLKLPGEMTEV